MSHSKKRAENTCLNCGTTGLQDRYCPHCGQENVEPKQSLWHLITHFFNDVTHFDGKFFSTLKLLITKPGFLSSEYVLGRRLKYLDPIRMYLFVSAIFLFFFLALNTEEEIINPRKHPEYVRNVDSMRISEYEDNFNFTYDDVQYENPKEHRQIMVLNFHEAMRHGVSHFDSVQRAYPDSFKFNRLENFLIKRFINSYQVYDADPYNFVAKAVNGFWHSISKISFISLPVFATFLFLLYIRRRKNYYYVAHVIFSLHYYIVAFFIILLTTWLGTLSDTEWMANLTAALLLIGLFAYLYVAMLRFYKQGWFKTFLKTLILYIASIVFILLLGSILFINSFLNMSVH